LKKNILLISLYYPPIQSIASNRIESITKYLNSDLFNIDVITLQEKGSLPYETKDNVAIFRVPNKSFFRPFRFAKPTNILLHTCKVIWNLLLQNLLPEFYGWKKEAQSLIQKLKKEKTYDIILSSYAPAVTHELALIAKKNSTSKWIADMRDEMSLNPFLSSIKKTKLAKLEQKIFDACDMITSVSKPILEDFRNLAKTKAKNIRFVEIRNGYDFPIVEISHPKNSCFTISYIGSFYGERNPENFLKALSLLYNQEIFSIKVNLIGTSKPIYIPKNLSEVIEISSLVSHSRALEIMHESDALLLIHPTTGRKGVYTGKLFEYLGMLKPIIALVDKEDVAAHLIKQTNAGYIAENSDLEDIQNCILEAYNQWKDNTIRLFNTEIIAKHHRKEQIKRLEKAILELSC